MTDRTTLVSEHSVDNEIYNQTTFDWWDSTNKCVYGLHQIRDIRMKYIQRVLKDKTIGSIVDVGCGGGVTTEEIYKAYPDADVRGIDISAHSIQCAKKHSVYDITYAVGSAYDTKLADASQDAVVMLDILEHLDDLPRAIREVSRVLKPDGVFIYDTFDRTFWSWLFGIFFAEIVFRLLPRHTHDWRLFIKPAELSQLFAANGLTHISTDGFTTQISVIDMLGYIIFGKIPKMKFAFTESTSVQYFGNALKNK